jgi:hypothetical protein
VDDELESIWKEAVVLKMMHENFHGSLFCAMKLVSFILAHFSVP